MTQQLSRIRHGDDSLEFDLFVASWLQEERLGLVPLPGQPSKKRTSFYAASDLNRTMTRPRAEAWTFYLDFCEVFAECYPASGGPGRFWIERSLPSGLEEALTPAIEWTLNRIHDRRAHLLGSFRRAKLGQFFCIQPYTRRDIRCYLRGVARMEALKAPLTKLLRQKPTEPARLREIVDPLGDEAECNLHDLGHQLDRLWSQSRFDPDHRLDGLVTLGFHWMLPTGALRTILERLILCKSQQADQRGELLAQRAALLSERLERLARERESTADPICHQQIDASRDRTLESILRLQDEMRRDAERRWLRPREVAALLSHLPGSGTVRRTGRINREIQLLRERVHVRLPSAFQAAPTTVQFLARWMQQHLASEPPSPSGHQLPAAVRQARQRNWMAWHDQGRDLVHQIRALALPPRESDWIEWLWDVENYYNYGVLASVGIVGGLSRPGPCRDHLLRV